MRSKPKPCLYIGSRRAHTVIMERVLGRKLKPGEVVHHKDENTFNNSIDNLELITQSEHATLHGLREYCKWGHKFDRVYTRPNGKINKICSICHNSWGKW